MRNIILKNILYPDYILYIYDYSKTDIKHYKKNKNNYI